MTSLDPSRSLLEELQAPSNANFHPKALLMLLPVLHPILLLALLLMSHPRMYRLSHLTFLRFTHLTDLHSPLLSAHRMPHRLPPPPRCPQPLLKWSRELALTPAKAQVPILLRLQVPSQRLSSPLLPAPILPILLPIFLPILLPIPLLLRTVQQSMSVLLMAVTHAQVSEVWSQGVKTVIQTIFASNVFAWNPTCPYTQNLTDS